MPGRAHVVVKGADDARVLRVSTATAASWRGVREARVLDLAPGRIARPARRGRRSRAARARRSRSPPAPRPSWRSPWRPPHRRRSNRTRRPSTRSATTRPRPRSVRPALAHDAAARHVKTATPRRPGRRRHLRRQVAPGPRVFSASRLALRTRRCFDRGMPRVRLTAGRWLALAVISGGICVSPVLRLACRCGTARRGPPTGGVGCRQTRPTGRDGRATARRDRCAATAGCRRSPQETLQHRRRLADDAARPAGRHPGARREGGRAAAAPGCQRRLAALQLDRARGPPPDADQLRAVPRPAGRARRCRPGADGDRSRRRGQAPPRRSDGLVQPTFKGGSPAASRPARPIPTVSCDRPSAAAPARRRSASDPDGVIRPTFAVRPRWSAFAADPDGLIAPTFVPYRRLSSLGDADDLIDPTRTQEGRTVARPLVRQRVTR